MKHAHSAATQLIGGYSVLATGRQQQSMGCSGSRADQGAGAQTSCKERTGLVHPWLAQIGSENPVVNDGCIKRMLPRNGPVLCS